jgi:hypothetical protein
VTPLERRCRWLLFAYPAWYRRERAGEMLGTLLETSPPGKRWPSFRDTRSLVAGGLRVRGWVWLLSMLWVVAAVAETGYCFYITTKPYTWADVGIGIEGWSTDPVAVQIAVVLATAASLALPVPALIAGFIRLRGSRPRSWLRIAAWAGAWIAGFALIYQATVWGNYPANCPVTGGPGMSDCPAIGSPAVVSWGELAICAAWLVLGAVLTWILAGPGHCSDVPYTSSRLPSAKGSRLPPGTDDVQA